MKYLTIYKDTITISLHDLIETYDKCKSLDHIPWESLPRIYPECYTGEVLMIPETHKNIAMIVLTQLKPEWYTQ
jgi:hypothetical protein